MQSKRAAMLKTPLGANPIHDEKSSAKAKQEKQRFYEQRRRQELNDSLDGLKDLMLGKFRISSQSLASKRAVVDAAIKLLQLCSESTLPDIDTLMLLTSTRLKKCLQCSPERSQQSTSPDVSDEELMSTSSLPSPASLSTPSDSSSSPPTSTLSFSASPRSHFREVSSASLLMDDSTSSSASTQMRLATSSTSAAAAFPSIMTHHHDLHLRLHLQQQQQQQQQQAFEYTPLPSSPFAHAWSSTCDNDDNCFS